MRPNQTTIQIQGFVGLLEGGRELRRARIIIFVAICSQSSYVNSPDRVKIQKLTVNTNFELCTTLGILLCWNDSIHHIRLGNLS